MAPAISTTPDAIGARSESLKQAQKAKSNNADRLWQLHQDGAPFVMPFKRGIDMTAPDFDPHAFLDLLGEDFMYIQHEVLREILELQGDVEYLRRQGLNGRTDIESFRKCVPVVSYADIEADILKLVNGEQPSIFTVDPITHFHSSSGTTGGKPKYIPSTARAEEGFDTVTPPIVGALYRSLFPVKQGKVLNIAFAGKQKITPSGLKVGAWTTNIYRNPRFLDRDKGPDDEFCVPDEVILCDDITQGIYCHLLCALSRAPEIVRVFSIFAASIVTAARVLQNKWREMVEDIRTGTLNNFVTEPEMRAAVEKSLKPNPDLASMIERECSQEDWEGIFPRLFPNALYVSCILSGSMLQYAPTLQHLSGHLPTICPAYAASESGLIGINFNMKCAVEDIAYMLWPEKNYYEFISLDDNNGEQNGHGEGVKILEACDLEVGKEYEILITNCSGFYRYRLGDVIRVTSFHKTVPVFAFVRRISVVLSVHADKTDEKELQDVVSKAKALLKSESSAMELSDYTSTTDVSSLPGRYIIFWEMADSRKLDQDVLQKCADLLDASFNYIYQWGRSHGFIGPLELRIVREGTFDKIMNAAVRRGASPSQYKPPRCVNHPQGLEILKEGTIGSFHSKVQLDVITYQS
ncbi:hypothetical protein KC19_7G149200 [Ceratodon purpureus]|uniref:Uncharacterized protein n=1 Tax=Ceratodon purpureus TaxID=3225 RepID=A0A8T0H887_CERPU|nr:hypothetical protein KC19_7G149200 [Ceratodon purpureus]